MVNRNPYTQRPQATAYSAFAAGVAMTCFALINDEPLLFLSLAGLFYYSAAWMYWREYQKQKEKRRE